MKLTVSGFDQGAPIPGTFAFCAPAEEEHVTFAPNKNPEVRWSDLPDSTRSLALIVHDPDVPSVGDDVNQEGRSVPPDLPRIDFFHWVLVDIPAELPGIPEGAAADGVTPHGKPTGRTPHGITGYNDYTGWFKGDPDMEGTYGGYDGPCPPWNDERLHHYHFTLYALDVPSLKLTGDFGGEDARTALEGHVLAKAEHVGTYTLNPALR